MRLPQSVSSLYQVISAGMPELSMHVPPLPNSRNCSRAAPRAEKSSAFGRTRCAFASADPTKGQLSQIEVAGEAGVFLDVVEAQFGAAAHQGLDQLLG